MSARRRILVTPRSITRHGHRSLARLEEAGYEVQLGPAGRQPNEEELRAALRGCVGYVAGVEPVTAAVLAAADALRVISRNGTGVDNIDLAAAATRGIAVLRAEGANARGVAELTLALMLALARGVAASDQALKRGGWERTSGVELEHRVLGLVGCGRVGRIVAGLAHAFGMTVLAHDPVAERQASPPAGVSFRLLEDVLREADFVSLHCPPAPDGRPLLDAVALAALKTGSYIINTARFDLLDAAAVSVALDAGRLRGLALDVFAQEPPVGCPLVQHPRVIATPHVGGFTTESVDRAMDTAVENLLHHLGPAGGAPGAT